MLKVRLTFSRRARRDLQMRVKNEPREPVVFQFLVVKPEPSELAP